MIETRTVYASGVMGVPSHIIGNIIADITTIKRYGMGKLVSCCILEKGMSPTEEGSVRRCTLCMNRFHDAMLRERLASVTRSEERTCVVLDYIPCGSGEVHRSPFGKIGSERLLSAQSTYTVSQVTTAANKCFVEVSTVLTISRTSETDYEPGERELLHGIQLFWQNYVDNMLMALEAFVLSLAYPLLNGRIDSEFREAYEQQEDMFCQWASSMSETFPRQLVLESFEKMLVNWSRVLQEYRHQKLAAEAVKADVEGANRVAAETARQLAESAAMVEQMRKEQLAEEEAQQGYSLYPPTNGPEDVVPAPLPNARRDCAHHRRLYQTSGSRNTTSDALQKNLGRAPPAVYGTDPQRLVALAVSDSTRARLSELLMDDKPSSGLKSATPKLRALPKHYHRGMLNHLFTNAGTLDEEEARAIFKVLDTEQNDCLTSKELVTILLSMDHTGLYEDLDGTNDQLELCRRHIRQSYVEHNRRRGDVDAVHSDTEAVQQEAAGVAATATAAATGPPATSSSAFSAAATESVLGRMVACHEAEKAVRREKAMGRLAEDTVNRYAFREGGKLHFDEFCLALMQLFKS